MAKSLDTPAFDPTKQDTSVCFATGDLGVFEAKSQEDIVWDKILEMVKQGTSVCFATGKETPGGASCYRIMRELNVSYSRAVRFMDLLEERGVVQSIPATWQQSEDGTWECSQIAVKGPRPLVNAEWEIWHKSRAAKLTSDGKKHRKAEEEAIKEKARLALEAKSRVVIEPPSESRKVRRK